MVLFLRDARGADGAALGRLELFRDTRGVGGAVADFFTIVRIRWVCRVNFWIKVLSKR